MEQSVVFPRLLFRDLKLYRLVFPFISFGNDRLRFLLCFLLLDVLLQYVSLVSLLAITSLSLLLNIHHYRFDTIY